MAAAPGASDPWLRADPWSAYARRPDGGWHYSDETTDDLRADYVLDVTYSLRDLTHFSFAGGVAYGFRVDASSDYAMADNSMPSVMPSASGTSSPTKLQSAFEMLGLRAPGGPVKPVDQGERFIQAITGEKRNMPTWTGQPASLRSWLKLLAVWESETTLSRDKWGLRLFQSFTENSQPRKIADQIPMVDLLSGRGYGFILAKYKPFLDIAAPAAIDRFFYSPDRPKGESFAAPLDRPELLAQAAEAELGAQGAKHFAVVNQFDGNFIEDEEEHAEQFLEDEESESLQEDELYFEDREYDEEAAMFISAYHSAYADIRRDLKDRRKERGYVRHKGPSSSSFRDRDRGKGKGKRSERSKSRPDSGRAYRRSYNKVSDQRMLKGVSAEGRWQGRRRIFCVYTEKPWWTRRPKTPFDRNYNDGGFSLYKYNRMLPSRAPELVVQAVVDVPTSIAGILGVVRFSVVEDSKQTSPLLPISYLETIRAVLDFGNDLLRTPEGHQARMLRLAFGQRAIDILKLAQMPWSLPDAFRGLGRDPFCSTASGSGNAFFGGVASAAAAAPSELLPSPMPVSSPLRPSSTTATSSTLSSTAMTTVTSSTPSSTVVATAMSSATSSTGVEELAAKYLEEEAFSYHAFEAWLRKRFPEGQWTSWNLNINVVAKPHQDSQDAKSSWNHTVSFGKFTQGELWLESEDPPDQAVRWKQEGKKRVPGVLISTFQNPTTINPHRYRGTMPWSGFRISVTAYTTRNVAQVGTSVRSRLEEIGFPVPVQVQSFVMHTPWTGFTYFQVAQPIMLPYQAEAAFQSELALLFPTRRLLRGRAPVAEESEMDEIPDVEIESESANANGAQRGERGDDDANVARELREIPIDEDAGGSDGYGYREGAPHLRA
ncbi:unnamed protein product, partial [Symbiodinium microadriaticum]